MVFCFQNIFFCSRRLPLATLHEVLDQIDDEDNLPGSDVFLIPPDPAEDSDEYSGDEEDVIDLGHLPQRMLYAHVEVQGPRDAEEVQASDDNVVEEGVEEPQSRGQLAAGTSRDTTSGRRQHSARRRGPASSEDWIKKATTQSKTYGLFPPRNVTQYQELSPKELFMLFFDDEMMSHIVEETNFYARKKSNIELALTKEEMYTFLGILMLSGYSQVPRYLMYWESGVDMGNQAVQDAMRKNRFRDIKRYIHFEREVNKTDRFSKVRSIAGKLQKSFLQHYQPGRFLSHDECMVKYFGRSSLKQSIRLKPIRFGYKVWAMNDPLGYLVAFELYQGENFEGNPAIDAQVGKCSGTVLHLIDQIQRQDHLSNLQFHVMCDNLFTSARLFRCLLDRGIHGTGTVRQNRVKDPLLSSDLMNKQKRGYIEAAETVDGGLKLTKWKDNKGVTIMSTVYGVEPKDKARRWSAAEKKHIQVPRPAAVREYNRQMGGTDRMNQNINVYRCNISGKKFYWNMFTWLLDASVSNAWCLHRMAGGELDQLRFRREIVMTLFRLHGKPRGNPGPPRAMRALGNEARYEGSGHFPKKLEGTTRQRCKNEQCTRADGEGRGPLSRYFCVKCKVALCLDDCFIPYHTR